MKIGTYELTGIETGTFALDGGAMFGVVPKPLWEKVSPCRSQEPDTDGCPGAARAGRRPDHSGGHGKRRQARSEVQRDLCAG